MMPRSPNKKPASLDARNAETFLAKLVRRYEREADRVYGTNALSGAGAKNEFTLGKMKSYAFTVAGEEALSAALFDRNNVNDSDIMKEVRQKLQKIAELENKFRTQRSNITATAIRNTWAQIYDTVTKQKSTEGLMNFTQTFKSTMRNLERAAKQGTLFSKPDLA